MHQTDQERDRATSEYISSKAQTKRSRQITNAPSSSDESSKAPVGHKLRHSVGQEVQADGDALGPVPDVLDGDALGVVVTMVPAATAPLASYSGASVGASDGTSASIVTPAPTATPAPPTNAPTAPIPVSVSTCASASHEPGADTDDGAASKPPPTQPKRMSFGSRMRSAYEDSSSSDDDELVGRAAIGASGHGSAGTGHRGQSGSVAPVSKVSRSTRTQGASWTKTASQSEKTKRKKPSSALSADNSNLDSSSSRGGDTDGQDTWSHYEAQHGRRFRPFQGGDVKPKRTRSRAKPSVESEDEMESKPESEPR